MSPTSSSKRTLVALGGRSSSLGRAIAFEQMTPLYGEGVQSKPRGRTAPERRSPPWIQAAELEHLWSPAGATGGNRWQIGHPRKQLKQADRQPMATHGNRFGAHGKEGVDGSSPSEGFKLPAKAGFLLPKLVQRSTSFAKRGTMSAKAASRRGTGVNPGERKAPSPGEEDRSIVGTGFGDTADVKAEVPKGPSLDPSVRRLAVPFADHALSAGEFEGVHEGGARGSGAVIIWDEGDLSSGPRPPLIQPARPQAQRRLRPDPHRRPALDPRQGPGTRTPDQAQTSSENTQPAFAPEKHGSKSVEQATTSKIDSRQPRGTPTPRKRGSISVLPGEPTT